MYTFHVYFLTYCIGLWWRWMELHVFQICIDTRIITQMYEFVYIVTDISARGAISLSSSLLLSHRPLLPPSPLPLLARRGGLLKFGQPVCLLGSLFSRNMLCRYGSGGSSVGQKGALRSEIYALQAWCIHICDHESPECPSPQDVFSWMYRRPGCNLCLDTTPTWTVLWRPPRPGCITDPDR